MSRSGSQLLADTSATAIKTLAPLLPASGSNVVAHVREIGDAAAAAMGSAPLPEDYSSHAGGLAASRQSGHAVGTDLVPHSGRTATYGQSPRWPLERVQQPRAAASASRSARHGVVGSRGSASTQPGASRTQETP